MSAIRTGIVFGLILGFVAWLTFCLRGEKNGIFDPRNPQGAILNDAITSVSDSVCKFDMGHLFDQGCMFGD